MTRSYLPPHYSTAGIRLMGQMFEQQMRMAQSFGAAAVAANPLLNTAPQVAPAITAKDLAATTAENAPVKRTRAPSAPPPMPAFFGQTRATPV